ncbi:hypothetical protein RQP46_003623 [Phenoliferia psychrophenolica]
MFELAVVNQAATSWTGDVLRKTPQLQSLCVTTEQVEAGVANLVESSNPLPFRLIHLGLTLYSALDCSRLLNALFTASVDSLVSLRLTIDCEANDHDYEVLKTNLALVAPNLERLDLQFLLVSDGPPSMPLPLVSTYVDIAVFKSLKHLGILSGIKKDEDLPGLCLDRLPLPATLVHLTMLRLAPLLGLLAALVAAAPAPTVPSIPVNPHVDPFYQPTAGWQQTTPGTILANRTVIIAALTAVPIPVSGYQLLYRTTDAFGNPMVTVTTIMVPVNATSDKLVAYASAEDAVNIQCAPSFTIQEGAPTSYPTSLTTEQAIMEIYLAQGWIMTLVDYEGPNSAYVAGPQQGRAVLDAIRATLLFGSSIGLDRSAKVVMTGYSGGAIGVGWAEALLSSYASELNIVGSATGGTPASLRPSFIQINNGFESGLIVAALTGLGAGYPAFNASMYSLATPLFNSMITDAIENNCGGESKGNSIDFFADTTYFSSGRNTLSEPVWVETFALTQLGTANKTLTPTIPIHMYHALDDEFIPYSVARELADSWCSQGANLEFITNQ